MIGKAWGAVLVAVLCASCPALAETRLSFGLYASDKPSNLVRMFRPALDVLERDLAASLGGPVAIEMKISKTYDEGVEALISGAVDFSRFGPASYVSAKRRAPGLSVLAIEAVEGGKEFFGIIAVHRDGPIRSIDDLRGRSFAFGSDDSTIGRYLSQLFLADHGIKASGLARYEYLGRHDTVGEAVAAGLFDAGALKENTFNKIVAAGKPLRELARFPNVTKPWIARQGLDPRIRKALSEALLAFDDPAVLKPLEVTGFLAGDDADFDTIRRSMEHNAAFFD